MFEREARRALRQAVLQGRVNRADARLFRLGLFMPGVRRELEQLAAAQLATEGETLGRDWSGFAEFLERIIPLLVQAFLEIFGALAGGGVLADE